MCQVQEQYHEPLARAALHSGTRKCFKCKETCAAVVVRAGDAYCSSCFKDYFVHKFRATLGKNRVIFPGDKVLLAVSGGPSSSSMLSQVLEGLSQNAHKKLRFLPGIVYIDEGGAVGQCVEEREAVVSQLRALFRATGLPFHTVALEQVLDLPSSVVLAAPPPPERPASAYKVAVDGFLQRSGSEGCREPQEPPPPHIQESHTHSLQQLLASAGTLTAREDLLSTLRQHLLVHTARSEGYSKLMLGDSCTRLAVKLLTSISLGRGAQLAQDTGFSDSRYGDILTVRPMRDYTAKEIAFYNYMFKVPSVVTVGLDTKVSDKASIQHLTESFVTKLQADFPSTVSTIYRTSEKLQAACRTAPLTEHWVQCLLCMCSLDTNIESASAFQATQISEQLSTKSQSGDGADPSRQNPDSSTASRHCRSSSAGEDCGKAADGGGCCSSSSARCSGADLRSLVCYSCQLTLRDMVSVDHLPHYILSEAERRTRRSRLRKEISGFLLAEDGEEAD